MLLGSDEVVKLVRWHALVQAAGRLPCQIIMPHPFHVCAMMGLKGHMDNVQHEGPQPEEMPKLEFCIVGCGGGMLGQSGEGLHGIGRIPP